MLCPKKLSWVSNHSESNDRMTRTISKPAKETQENGFSEKSQVFGQGKVKQCGARFSDANYPKAMKDC